MLSTPDDRHAPTSVTCRFPTILSDGSPSSHHDIRGGFEWNIGFMTYGERWKRHRKWFQQGFQSKKHLDSYVPIQKRERARLMVELLREPVAYGAHVKR